MLCWCHKNRETCKPQGEGCIGKYAVKRAFITGERWIEQVPNWCWEDTEPDTRTRGVELLQSMCYMHKRLGWLHWPFFFLRTYNLPGWVCWQIWKKFAISWLSEGSVLGKEGVFNVTCADFQNFIYFTEANTRHVKDASMPEVSQME